MPHYGTSAITVILRSSYGFWNIPNKNTNQ